MPVGKIPTAHLEMRSASLTHRHASKSIQSVAIDNAIYFLNDPQTAAFQQFLNASRHGHAGASVEVAWYLSTGNLEGVSQDVERAVM